MLLSRSIQEIPQRLMSRAGRLSHAFWSNVVQGPSAVILNYHRVNEPTSEANNVTVSVENFEDHLRVIKGNYLPVSLRSIINGEAFRLAQESDLQPVAVTFDDGYADTYLNAVPLLERYEIPATVFVTTGAIGENQEFWWDELEELFLNHLGSTERLKFIQDFERIIGKRIRFDKHDLDEAYRELCVEFKKLSWEQIKKSICLLREHSRVNQVLRESHRPVTIEELQLMAQCPFVEIGAHTVNHLSLGHISESNQRDELKNSKEFLEKIINKPIDFVAYPYGGDLDYNKLTMRICSDLNYSMGLTTQNGLTTQKTAPYCVPRMYIKNWNRDEFKHQLSRYFWVC